MNQFPFLKMVEEVDLSIHHVIETRVVAGTIVYLVFETSDGKDPMDLIVVTEYNDNKEKHESHELNIRDYNPVYGCDRQEALSFLKESALQDAEEHLYDAIRLVKNHTQFVPRKPR